MCGVCGGWGGGRSLKVVCFLSGDLIKKFFYVTCFFHGKGVADNRGYAVQDGRIYFKCGCYNCLFATIYVLAYFPVVALYVCMLLVFSFCLFVLCLDCCNKYNTCGPRRHNFVPQL